ncbi:hypothetical protein ACHAW5_000508 [Stephanodiscus triporus]|uniref:Cytochrome b561 domain-containing protein n=1 Tax=Stephanodiscus triporus TaxID=2934178 RepID=A0ABD3NQ20_9STRA
MPPPPPNQRRPADGGRPPPSLPRREATTVVVVRRWGHRGRRTTTRTTTTTMTITIIIAMMIAIIVAPRATAAIRVPPSPSDAKVVAAIAPGASTRHLQEEEGGGDGPVVVGDDDGDDGVLTMVWDGKDPSEAVAVVDEDREDRPVVPVCPEDVRECHSGGIVERDPDSGCAFYPCPDIDEETGVVDWADDSIEGEEELVGEWEDETISSLAATVEEKDVAAHADEQILEEMEGGGVGSASSYQSSGAPDVVGSRRSSWVAHGTIGALAFGLLVPAAISSSLLRDCMPVRWVYVHVGTNTLSFVATLVAVGVAVATMHGTIAVEGGRHMDERHHVAGLLLLLLVSFQTANGFMRPPRESDRRDDDARSYATGGGGITRRRLWHCFHVTSGLFIFVLGACQVRSGLGLFADRFGVPDYGMAYVVYISSLAVTLIGVKAWMMWREKKKMMTRKSSNPELQLPNGGRIVNNGDQAYFHGFVDFVQVG